MKKNYEKKDFIIFITFMFIVTELIIIFISYKKTYRTYKDIVGIVVTDNYIKTYVDESNYKKLRSSKRFYIDDKKYYYKIIDIEKNELKNNNKSYHELMINFNIPKKYKDNDSINISIYDKKEKLFNIFKKCWESEL